MGTLRLHYEEKIYFETYRGLFFTQTQSDQNPHTKSGQNRAKSKNFLVPCDSSIRGEGGFRRPGVHLAGKHAHQVY